MLQRTGVYASISGRIVGCVGVDTIVCGETEFFFYLCCHGIRLCCVAIANANASPVVACLGNEVTLVAAEQDLALPWSDRLYLCMADCVYLVLKI